MIVDQPQSVFKIPLEQPASVRRHLPASGDGWMLPEYVIGPENAGLRYLFDPANIARLAELSPILLYGERGVGKTALAVTLAVTWSRLVGLRPLAFTTGQTFAGDFSSGVEIGDLDAFRLRHRECQALVIDDLDELAKAPAAQQELVNTLDVHSEASRPVIVAVSRLPASIRGFTSALSSRLCGGYSVGVQKPGILTSRELVEQIVPIVDAKLPIADMQRFVEKFIGKSLKLDDIHRLVAIASHNRNSSGAVDFHVVAQLAEQLFSGDGPTLPSIAKIVSRRMQVRLTEMRGATRKASIVRARGLAIYLTRKLTPTSLQQIGEFFGGRDHSTIIHACRKTEQLLANDTELANLLVDVQSELLS